MKSKIEINKMESVCFEILERIFFLLDPFDLYNLCITSKLMFEQGHRFSIFELTIWEHKYISFRLNFIESMKPTSQINMRYKSFVSFNNKTGFIYHIKINYVTRKLDLTFCSVVNDSHQMHKQFDIPSNFRTLLLINFFEWPCSFTKSKKPKTFLCVEFSFMNESPHLITYTLAIDISNLVHLFSCVGKKTPNNDFLLQYDNDLIQIQPCLIIPNFSYKVDSVFEEKPDCIIQSTGNTTKNIKLPPEYHSGHKKIYQNRWIFVHPCSFFDTSTQNMLQIKHHQHYLISCNTDEGVFFGGRFPTIPPLYLNAKDGNLYRCEEYRKSLYYVGQNHCLLDNHHFLIAELYFSGNNNYFHKHRVRLAEKVQ